MDILDKLRKKNLRKKEDQQPRNEAAGMLNFGKEMVSALVTALIFIVYVIQAFTIPTGSMEKSLRVGDFLLGLKFVYGSPVIPFTYAKFPGITSPKRGDVIIFKYPGYDKKDYIKRCVAVAGDSLWINGKDLYVNGIKLDPPQDAQFSKNGQLASDYFPQLAKLDNFAPLYVPKKGDTLMTSGNIPWREFYFYKRLIRQEHPKKNITEQVEIIYNGKDITDMLSIPYTNAATGEVRELALSQRLFNEWDRRTTRFWFDNDYEIDLALKYHRIHLDSVQVLKSVLLDGEKIDTYVCKYNNYFMMGDNRDDSSDSRFWGFLNKNFIKAKAFIIYFALNREKENKLNENGQRVFDSRGFPVKQEVIPWVHLPKKIRWNRLGKLIRGWDGKPEGVESLDPKS